MHVSLLPLFGKIASTVASLYNDCIGYQENFCYIELLLLRSIIAVRTQWLVPISFVLTSRLSLQRVPLHPEITVEREAAPGDRSCCHDAWWLGLLPFLLLTGTDQGDSKSCVLGQHSLTVMMITPCEVLPLVRHQLR